MATLAPVSTRTDSHIPKDVSVPSWLTILDRTVWERHLDGSKHGLDFAGETSLTSPFLKRAIKLLQPLSERVKNEKGITLMMVPAGLTLRKLQALAAEPKEGEAVDFMFCGKVMVPEGLTDILSEFGHKAVEKTHWVFFTNGPLKLKGCASRKHELIVESLSQIYKTQFHMPELLELITGIALRYIADSSTRLYAHESREGTRCREMMPGNWSIHIQTFNRTADMTKPCIYVAFGDPSSPQGLGLSALVKEADIDDDELLTVKF